MVHFAALIKIRFSLLKEEVLLKEVTIFHPFSKTKMIRLKVRVFSVYQTISPKMEAQTTPPQGVIEEVEAVVLP